MLKKIALMLTMVFLWCPLAADAAWIIDIFNKLLEIYGINLEQLTQMSELNNVNKSQLDEMQKLERTNQEQNKNLTSILNGLTGTHDYGSQYLDSNHYNWGHDADSWQSILALAKTEGSGSALGSIMKQLSGQYPVDKTLGSRQEAENQYYRMQAQTTLASRASAELSFSQMNQSMNNMKQLQSLIDKTKDNKSSVDLNNRLAAENAQISIQQTKLLAVLVQQMAMDSQQKANAAMQTAHFFNSK